ncbi:MAG: 6-bladed beta-propeller [Balneolaceae bacterium]|nr:6-bladed beta-propeller [Balneolaceae bacterium]
MALISCSEPSNKSSSEDSGASRAKSLSQLLNAAPIQEITINQNNISQIQISKNNWQGKSLSNEATILGKPRGIIAVGESLYVADEDQNGILVMDNTGIIHRKIGRKGKGPKEFSDLKAIFRNKEFIFTADQKKAGIQVYDKNFHYLDFIPVVLMALHHPNTGAVNQKLFLPTSFENPNFLIDIYKAKPPFEKKDSFFPKLIPNGYQPMAYN